MQSRIAQELKKFRSWPENLCKRGLRIHVLEEFCFSVDAPDAVDRTKLDLLITGLVHGDEVIGIEVMNLILDRIISGAIRLRIRVGFLLCNPNAAKAGMRFIDSDLNRSFLVEAAQTYEHRRALEVATIVKEASFVFDLHQTVEPTESPFFVFEHKPEIIRLARQLLHEIPIVTFPTAGFSQGGKTMLEFASSVGVPALAMECGKSGFSRKMAENVARTVFNLIDRLSNTSNERVAGEGIEVHYLCESISNDGQAYLIPGLTNYMPVRKGQLLGYQGEKHLTAPFDGRLFFPKYGVLAQRSPELCDLGKRLLISI